MTLVQYSCNVQGFSKVSLSFSFIVWLHLKQS